jgi:hypothetical protein
MHGLRRAAHRRCGFGAVRLTLTSLQ